MQYVFTIDKHNMFSLWLHGTLQRKYMYIQRTYMYIQRTLKPNNETVFTHRKEWEYLLPYVYYVASQTVIRAESNLTIYIWVEKDVKS